MPFTDLDLYSLLDPQDLGKWRDAKDKKEQFSRALGGFYLQDTATAPQRRNRIQDILLAASDQQFQSWQRDLRSIVTSGNFAFDFFEVTLSGLATILTPLGTKTALSGAATIIGGTEAAVDANYFADKTLEVIVKGMEARRARIFATILGSRITSAGQLVSVQEYTVEGAIRDALLYHAAASVGAGLEEASSATQQAKEEQQQLANPRFQRYTLRNVLRQALR